MRTEEGPLSLPGWRIGAGGLVRIRRGFAAAPLIIKILLVAALVFFFPAVVGVLVLAALVYAPFALSACRRSVFASLSVAVWGLAGLSGLPRGYSPWLSLLLGLPLARRAEVSAGSRAPAQAEGRGPGGGARAARAGRGRRRRRSAPSTPPRALRPSPGPMPPMTVPPGRPRSRWTRPWPS